MVSFLEEMARERPNAFVIFSHCGKMTYRELDDDSNRLAKRLIHSGVAQGDIVALYMNRSLELFVAIWAILKAGAAYLPVDTKYPQERVRYILKDSDIKCVLCHASLKLEINEFPVISWSENLHEDLICNLHASYSSKQLMYVMYTSGSTGHPKGVMIRQYSVVNRLIWMKEALQITPQDRILHKTPYTFDVSVWEIFLSVFTGAATFLLPHDMESNVQVILDQIEMCSITICHFVPSMLDAFLDYVKHKKSAHKLSSLRFVVVSGETLFPSLIEKFYQMLPKVQVINLYGPTETTVDSTGYFCRPEDSSRRLVPIGRPIWNTGIYILNANMELCDIGEAGEIYITGEGVAAGYQNNQELTNRMFLPDPFVQEGRMYRTGDMGTWDKDGNIIFLGRLDRQVKLQGKRIELDEIESVINKISGVGLSAVFVVGEFDNGKLICAYSGAGELPKEFLQEEARKFLPDYMVPDRFIYLNKMPYLSNGKLDRKQIVKQIKEK